MDKVEQVGTTAAYVTVICPPRGSIPVNLRELWAYRQLLYFFTYRDIKVRHKQTMFGVVRAIIQPLFTMIILGLLFSTLAKLVSEVIPYPLSGYQRYCRRTAVYEWRVVVMAAGLGVSSWEPLV